MCISVTVIRGECAMGVYIRSSQRWCDGLSGYQKGVYPFVCPLRGGIVYIRAQSPIVFQRHISGTCLFSYMYRGCVFFHFRLHLSAIVPRSPTWIVIYVLLGRDICSPADYTTSPPPPLHSVFRSVLLHVRTCV